MPFDQDMFNFLTQAYTDEDFQDSYEEKWGEYPTEDEVKREAKRRNLVFEWIATNQDVPPTRRPNMFKWVEDRMEKKDPLRHRFVTISLPKHLTPLDCTSLMTDFIDRHGKGYSKKIVIWTFECTNATLDYHPHIHFLMLGMDEGKSKLIRDIQKCFSQFDEENPLPTNFIDIKKGYDRKLFVQRLDYCKGLKNGKKAEALSRDDEVRSVHGIKKYHLIKDGKDFTE